MKRMIMAVLGTMVICISGCATSLSPHEELTRAVKKSLDATGFNYSSKSRVSELSLPKQDEETAANAKGVKYLGTGLDIVRGFSVNMDGAIDMTAKKSEVLYDLHYNKDNVDVSIKLPLLFDYNAQTIYVGTSLLNTVLDVVAPRAPETRGKLIKINIGELLQEGAASTPELAKLIGGNRLSAKSMDLFNDVFKTVLLKAVTTLNDSSFSDQPLTGQDKKAGVTRHIRVTLGHGDAVAVVADLIGGVAQALFREGIINEKEHAQLLTLTDRQMLDGLADTLVLAMTNDVGIGHTGHIGYWATRLSVADTKGEYRIGVETVSTFDGYNAPHFSMTPEAGKVVDFKEVLAAVAAATARDTEDAAQPDEEAPDGDSCSPEEPAPDGAGSML
ncbi:hypothetical protein F6V30_02750 [Oryzomonas sagensis]|uniref:Curli production assembly/transport component CsgG n=1 Tax=Oryzomonas sagensis TaxID=2603857 RepID=A0ABQ6TR49_9BACT|nr:hypothetical protein [Oryzomonas sagensis]KAB0671516.1 hypothetical protein F6V30_02750 [Oryzomonas sagensis]